MSEDATKVLCQHQTIITVSRLEELLEVERTLEALEGAGVANWSGYSIAMASLGEGESDGA